MKNYTLLLIVFLVFLIIGCSSDINTPTVSENDGQAQLAPAVALTEDQINQKILTGAIKQIGWNGGQCKAWVQNLVPQVVSGRVIGPNDTSNPSSDYYRARWSPAGSVRVVWQLYPKNYCITSFPSSLKAGQIIQLRWRSTVPWPCCQNGPHTAIIKSVSTTNMEWYDSNFNPKKPETVSLHPFTMAQWQKYVAAWTVYQVI